MITQLFGKRKGCTLERSYPAPIADVWEAWTRPELLRGWWGPDDTTIIDCDLDLEVGGPDLHRDGSGATTNLTLQVTIPRTGSGAKMAIFGMRWGYTANLDHVEALLAAGGRVEP